MAARKIGKRLAPLELPVINRLSDETHEVICGIAGCVVRKKSLRRKQLFNAEGDAVYMVLPKF